MSRLQQLERALRALQNDPIRKASVTRRVAERYLEDKIGIEYDILFRLLILEGAAGVPFQTWAKLGRRGLSRAEQHFPPAEREVMRKNLWFTPANSRAIEALRGVLIRFIKERARGIGGSRQISVKEVLHHGLFGIPTTRFETEGSEAGGADAEDKIRYSARKAYTIGEALSNKIRSGEESPVGIATSIAGKYFSQIAWNIIKQIERHRAREKKLDLERNSVSDLLEGISAPQQSTDEAWGLVLSWLLDKSDETGKALRDLFLRAWSGWRQGSKMVQWLELSLEKGRFLTASEIQELLGIQMPTWIANYWKRAWALIAQALRADPTLVKTIERKVISAGFAYFDLDPDQVPDYTDIEPGRSPSGTRLTPKLNILKL